MNSPHHPHTEPTTEPDAAPAADTEHWWPRLADRINDWWMHREPTGPALRDMLRIPPVAATATILGVAAVLLGLAGLLVWWLVTGLIGIVAAIGSAIADTGGQHITTRSLTRTISEPVQTYLTQHTAGLPIPAHLAWITWLATTGGLFLAATLGSRGARIGWTLTGALTTAMVYAASPTTGRLVAAGLTVTAWSVLSIAALNRTTTQPSTHPIGLTVIPRRPAPVPVPDDSTD